MSKVKVKLLRPLDDHPEGEEVEFDRADAERLAGFGAVEIVSKPAEKAETESENKMEGEPENKAAPKSTTKKVK